MASAEPSSECVQAEIAQGTLVKGSAKWSPARTAPSAEFCMPTCTASCVWLPDQDKLRGQRRKILHLNMEARPNFRHWLQTRMTAMTASCKQHRWKHAIHYGHGLQQSKRGTQGMRTAT